MVQFSSTPVIQFLINQQAVLISKCTEVVEWYESNPKCSNSIMNETQLIFKISVQK